MLEHGAINVTTTTMEILISREACALNATATIMLIRIALETATLVQENAYNAFIVPMEINVNTAKMDFMVTPACKIADVSIRHFIIF